VINATKIFDMPIGFFKAKLYIPGSTGHRRDVDIIIMSLVKYSWQTFFKQMVYKIACGAGYLFVDFRAGLFVMQLVVLLNLAQAVIAYL
jgi:hypothetical protein